MRRKLRAFLRRRGRGRGHVCSLLLAFISETEGRTTTRERGQAMDADTATQPAPGGAASDGHYSTAAPPLLSDIETARSAFKARHPVRPQESDDVRTQPPRLTNCLPSLFILILVFVPSPRRVFVTLTDLPRPARPDSPLPPRRAVSRCGQLCKPAASQHSKRAQGRRHEL